MNDTAQQTLFLFGDGQADGSSDLRPLIGGKGASLAEMTRAGLNVPPGFTLSARCCQMYLEHDRQWPEGLRNEVQRGMQWLEQKSGRAFGRGDQPLLVAVRSGAAESMPGMMDTILNVGLNPECVAAVAQRTGDGCAAWRDYRDFLISFGCTVGGVDERVFTDVTAALLRELAMEREAQLNDDQLIELCERLRAACDQHTDRPVPDDPYEMLFQAVEAVFYSWQSERAVAYRKHHAITGLAGTAVNVQMMCPSEVSGVLFTAHPVDPALPHMVLESTFGLGEAVVLGKVTPDQFVIDRETLQIARQEIRTPDGTPSLHANEVKELAELGLRVEQYFGHACDIEWGRAGGRFFLLQARAIKRKERIDPAALEHARQAEITRLRGMASATGTVWSRYNLYEILPEPTPMTWSIVQQLMSGRGGFGLMYRDLGFDPDPALDEIGAFDLVCGRPYCNLDREPLLYYRQLPFEHPFAALKQEPNKALYPQARFNAARAGWRFWLFLPFIFIKLLRANRKLGRVTRTFADDFRSRILPPFVDETAKEAKSELAALDDAALINRLHYWIQRTLFDFARDSLKPTALADHVQGQLLVALTRLEAKKNGSDTKSAAERAQARLRQLVMGVHPEANDDLPSAVKDLSAGRMNQEQFLEKFGHRGHHEMELAHARWSEDPHELEQLLTQHRPLTPNPSPPQPGERGVGSSPVEGERGGDSPLYPRGRGVGGEGGNSPHAPDTSPFADYPMHPLQRAQLDQHLQLLRSYLALRETGKHHLMRGYALIRRILVELDRRYNLDGGIFFLTLDELPALLKGENLATRIAERRRQRDLLLKLPVPPVLFSDDLEAIGRAPAPGAAKDSYQGVPLSAGVAEGVALVLEELPDHVPDGEAFILVCPSTDPAWMPLFVRARALVMETGGMLSHGAIVAREFGLPAVAGLPGIHQMVRSGQRLHVDGGTGKVNVLD